MYLTAKLASSTLEKDVCLSYHQAFYMLLWLKKHHACFSAIGPISGAAVCSGIKSLFRHNEFSFCEK